jgi:hypothetical protein
MDDPRNIWQTQEVEEMRFSLEELRAKAIKFQRRIWRRNLREYLAALFVIVFFGLAFWNTRQIVPRIAFAWVIAWSIFYIWYMWRWGSASPVPADMGSAACVGFYRNELARQRDLLRSVWKWVILPILPGLVLIAAYKITSAGPGKLWQQLAWVAFEAALIAVVAWLNMRAARRLDRRISELDRDLATA